MKPRNRDRRSKSGSQSKPRDTNPNTSPNTSPNILRGRFKRARLPEVEAFTASLPFDRRLYRHDIRGSIAHARMLARVKLLSAREAVAIERGLRRIGREIDSGQFHFDLADEDIHIAIERRLIEIAGEAGRKLHTARSRNDQVALDLRLFLKDEIAEVIGLIARLRTALLSVASQHVETVMPGYTHMQRAQPVSLAHHILAYLEMFDRDRERFAQASSRADSMPLGAGALAGTTLPIDRAMVASELEFSRMAQNSIDAVSDRDFAADFLAAAALVMIHLSRMSEEIILWATSEFGFLTIPDEFSTGSSMMPQKKNPDLLELIRAKSGRVIGDLTAMLAIMKGLPLAYNSDLQEDKERVFDALDTVKPALDLMAKLWPLIQFDTARMRAAAGGFALATDFAEYLVARGVAFRKAHEIVGAMVRGMIEAQKPLDQAEFADIRRYSDHFDRDVMELLDPANSIKVRTVIGGPAPGIVRNRIRRLGG